MNFRQDNRKKNKYFTTNTIIIGIVCILVIFGIFRAGGGVARTIARPFWSLHTAITNSVAGMVEHFHTRQTLLTENTTLRATIDDDNQKLADYDAIVAENNELEATLSRTTSPHTKIMANVLVRPPLAPFDTLVVDVGTDDGIVKDHRVFVGDSELLGTVTDVAGSTATVSLFTLPGTQTQAFVLDMAITLVGRGGSNFEITIPKNVDIPVGTSAVMPGGDHHILGTVDAKISKQDDPYTKYLVRAPKNPNQLKFVLIEK